MGVWIAIGLCDGGIGSEQERVVDAGELFTYHVEGDQGGAVHDDPVNNAIQRWLRYRKKRKKRREKARHFGHSEKDNGRIYDQRKWNINAVDVRLTDVWVEDPLQYNNAKPRGLGEKSDLLQRQGVQHGLVAGHNARIGGKIQENVGERGDESERSRRKRERRVAGSLVG